MLARADAALARSREALRCLRQHGFSGAGFVAGPGEPPPPLPDRNAARRALDIRVGDGPVFAWAGPLPPCASLLPVLEAVAACERESVLAIPDGRGVPHDVVDRADALDILHRVRFVRPEGDGPGLRAYPSLLAAADALLCAPSSLDRAGAACGDAIALAQCAGLPIVLAGTPELLEAAGSGGWTVPPGDSALLARLLDRLAADPAALAAGARDAAAHAARRHGPEAAAASLQAALRVAERGRRPARTRPLLATARDLWAAGPGREPGRP